MNKPTSREIRRPAISAAIICFNEEKNIERCLDSLDWCDQIVAIDSGSTDRTLDILRAYERPVILHRPFDTYINQKNYALDHCDNDWVLSIDADETLPRSLIDEIQDLAFDVSGYNVGRRNFLGSREIKHGNWSPDYKLRLFRKSTGRWGGSNPHERFVIEGPTQNLNHRMLHYSFASREEFVARNMKYTRMMVDYLEDLGKMPFRGQAYIHWIGNFVKCYLLRGGILDGGDGLFLARHIAQASYLKSSLLAKRIKSREAPKHKTNIKKPLNFQRHLDGAQSATAQRSIASRSKRSA